MPMLIAVLFYVHASYFYGSALTALVRAAPRLRWMQRFSVSAVARLADVVALGASLGVYALAGGFS